MNIIDLEGKVIAIENLSLAIMQADDYRHFKHSIAGFEEFDNKQQTYWEDVYQKLIKLTAPETNS